MQCFDALWFVFVPGAKRSPEDTDYAVFVVPGDRPLFARSFHGYYWPHTSGVAREYLLARFALAVFARMRPFLLAGPKRRLARFVTAEDGNGAQVICEDLEREALVERYGAAAAAAAPLLPQNPPNLPIGLEPPRPADGVQADDAPRPQGGEGGDAVASAAVVDGGPDVPAPPELRRSTRKRRKRGG